MDAFTLEFIRLKQEIRDLKTAQTKAGSLAAYTGQGELPAGTYSGAYTWTISYADVACTDAPITSLQHGAKYSLLAYDSASNTQKVEMCTTSASMSADAFTAVSTRPILGITRDF